MPRAEGMTRMCEACEPYGTRARHSPPAGGLGALPTQPGRTGYLSPQPCTASGGTQTTTLWDLGKPQGDLGVLLGTAPCPPLVPTDRSRCCSQAGLGCGLNAALPVSPSPLTPPCGEDWATFQMWGRQDETMCLFKISPWGKERAWKSLHTWPAGDGACFVPGVSPGPAGGTRHTPSPPLPKTSGP
jgi:hypothetical protein